MNKTLTSLDVGGSLHSVNMGKEGGIAIIKALEVNFAIFIVTALSMTVNLTFLFFFCVLW